MSNATLFRSYSRSTSPDLEKVLKTMTNWDSVSASENAMGLLAMIRDVLHDKTGAKQTVMTFVESTIEFFTFC